MRPGISPGSSFRRRHFAGFRFSPAAFRRAPVFAGAQFCGRLQIEGPPAGKPKKSQKAQNRRPTSDRRTCGRHFAGFEISPAAFRRVPVFAGPQFCGRLQIEGPPAGKPKKPRKVQNRRKIGGRLQIEGRPTGGISRSAGGISRSDFKKCEFAKGF